MPTVSGPKAGTLVHSPTIKTAFDVDENLLCTKIPSPPESLNDEGILWWNYYCGLFVSGRILSKMFLTSMHNLCLQHMMRKHYLEELSEQGMMLEEMYVDKTKEVAIRRYPNPVVKDLRSIILEMDKTLASLGMTAYTSKVNNIDTTGAKAKSKKTAPPPSSLSTPSQESSS